MTRTSIILLVTSFFCIVSSPLDAAEGEAPVNDIITQLPKIKAADGHALAAVIMQQGAPAIGQICDLLVEPGTGDDTKARFALHGLALYVTRPGAEQERSVFTATLVKALGAEKPVAVKGFLIRQLALAGKDDAVASLSTFIDETDLGEPAVQALTHIGTPEAAAALVKGLASARGLSRVTLVRALGEMRATAAAAAILPLAESADRDTRHTALFAVANIGEPAAAKTLAKAAGAKGVYEQAQGTTAYLLFARRRAEAGDTAACAAICKQLLETRKEPHVVCAALRTLVNGAHREAFDAVLAALRHENDQIRAAARELVTSNGTSNLTDVLVAHLPLVPPAAQVALVEYLGEQGDPAALQALRETAAHATAMAAAARQAAERLDAGFVTLFNGTDLTGWTWSGKEQGRAAGYVVEHGAIVCPAKGGGNLYIDKEYADFIFRFEFKLTEHANNGLGIRTVKGKDAAYDGMELQILDNTSSHYKDKLDPRQYHASVYGAVAAKRGFQKPLGQWNFQEVTAQGNRITVKLNGTTILDADVGQVKQFMNNHDRPGWPRPKGYIGFLGHGTRVEFRNVRIKEL